MCGIAGAYFSNRAEPVQTMIEGMFHRGPDGHGVQVLPQAVLGHTRLSIIDLNGGRQPMGSAGNWISFNGEIYNFKDLHKTALASMPLKTVSDTEVLLQLYDKYGPECVDMLDGMFAFAIIHDGELFLARDPVGIKPLYYGWRDEVLFFASEIKVLQGQCDGIKEFPAGAWFHSERGWHQHYKLAEAITPFEGTEQQAMESYVAVLDAAVQKRLIADVPVGVSLSGGLDSSIIAYLAVKSHPRMETFAVGMEESTDLKAARLVADSLGTTHHEMVYTEADMIEALPQVLYHLESFDPALVRSAIPNYFLAKFASQRVKVILTGEGADELFAGYDYMARFESSHELSTELRLVTESLHNTNLQRADRITMAFGLEARIPFLDKQSVAMALGMPSEWKLHNGKVPKYFLRQAFAGKLPAEIIDRPKLKFSSGAGSSNVLAEHADTSISDFEYYGERDRLYKRWDYMLENKEALYYYRILREYLDDNWIFPHMGTSRSL